MVPEYILAIDRRLENSHFMCRFFAHWITCPNEDKLKNIECPNNHDELVRHAHDKIRDAKLLGKEIPSKQIKLMLNPTFDKNNQDDVDEMFLS